ncbi:MAG: hypothetical protein WGN25_12145 [Candidatus Electrothrix sp. GW3-4]|uniref:hypothetical protein n=1 Tax=Candidatus Electrothrix sp. GW3-4 TaxID=3126740 RepID=UPI0030CCE71F
MKKLSTFLSLAIAAVILSGCYVSPYYYGGYRNGYQCPPPIKVDVDIKKEKKKDKKPKCEPVCEPSCDCPPVYKPVCRYN